MVNSHLAQKFVNRIIKQLGYNVNVMDERGIIIASSDNSRIGSFHQGAYNIIKNNLPMDIVKDNCENVIGAQPGISMPVQYKNNIIGAVGVSGDPDIVMPFVKLVKLTFETMLEYEIYTDSVNRARMQGDMFIDALLFENPKNTTKIKRYSKEAGFDENYPRLPIIVNYDIPIMSERILSDLKTITSYNCQDIIYLQDKGRLVILKTIPQQNISNYKNLISLYINEINSLFPKLVDPKEVDCFHISFYVGTVQTNYGFYSEALNHAIWLENYLGNSKATINFFIDHITEYMSEQISEEMLKAVFDSYIKIIKKDVGIDMFIETVQALFDSNLNLDATAKKLFIHRNTVIFRLKKIKAKIGLEPIKNIKDAMLLFYLLYYLRKCK